MLQTIVPARQRQSKGSQIGAALSAGLGTYLQQGQQKEADKKLGEMLGFDVSGLSPEMKQEAFKQAMTAKGKAAEFAQEINQAKSIKTDIAKRRGLEEGAGEPYGADYKTFEQVTRPPKEPKKTQASQPIDPEQLVKINDVRSQPGFDDLDELGQYRSFTNAGVSKENAEAESKLRGAQLTRQQTSFDKSYEAQKDFIDDTTAQYKGFETEFKPRLRQMQSMNPDDVIGPVGAKVLEDLGIPLGFLDDPSSELYQKLSQDLLKGLPETYGNRILKVEVENFLKTIPTLMNSVEGRRMIASNMLKLGEMREVYYKEMRKQQQDGLSTGKNLPKDFQQSVFDQVKPEIDRINNEFVKMSQIKSVPKDTVPFFTPSGDIKFVPKDKVDWAIENQGRRIW